MSAIWQAMFDSLEEPAVLASREGAVMRANRAFVRLLGNVAGGSPVSETFGLAERSLDIVDAAVRTSEPASRVMELPRVHGRRYRVHAAPVREGDGPASGVLVVLHDVTGQAEAQRLASIGGLVGGVAHELNNPLSSVMGYAELCAASPAAPPELRDQLAIIRDEAKRAARIVRNLIDFARARRPERAMTQLNDIVRRVTDLVAYDLRTSRVRLERQLDDRLPHVMGDPGRLQQLIYALLQGARRACEEKGAEGRVRVSTRAADDRVTLSVEDSGPGVPAVDPSCRAIAEEHRGTIRGVERPGLGATVIVELPAMRDGAPSPEKLERPHGLSILVIDRDPTAVESLRQILGERNALVPVPDGAAALAALVGTKFDLVVTDLRLPGLNGRELYRFIVREKPDLTDRVVFTIGTGSSEDTDDFMRDLRIPTIAKPFAERDVLLAVAQALENR